jgi:predicted hydrocarbon binding protein
MGDEAFPLERIPQEGRINLLLRSPTRRKYGNRVIIFGSGTFVELQKGAEEILGDESSAVFYEAGIRSGKECVEALMEEWDERDLDLVKRFNPLINSLGIGRVKEFNIDRDQLRGHYLIENSFIADTYGSSDKPVCHFICGFIAGLLEEILKINMACEEALCLATGDPHCEFKFEKV